MPISIPAPNTKDPTLNYVLREILRRSVDGTIQNVFTPLASNYVVIGSNRFIINPFLVNVVAGFNTKVLFYDNVVVQRNVSIAGDAVVSGMLQVGVLVAPRVAIGSTVLLSNGILLGCDNSSSKYLLQAHEITNDDGSVTATLQLIKQ